MTLPDTVVALIRAAVPADVTVYDGIVPDEPGDRYAVVYIDDGTLRALAVCGQSDSATLRWQVTSVAPDREMASWIATKIRGSTVDVNPVVAGWSCGQIGHTFSERPGRDESVPQRTAVFKVDLYDLLATRV